MGSEGLFSVFGKERGMKKLWSFFGIFIVLTVMGGNVGGGDTAEAAAIETYRKGFSYETISSSVKKQIIGKSYRKNRHIKLKDLRYVKVLHYGFDGKVKKGELIVHKKIAKKTVRIFYELYQAKYPIQKMKLIDHYHANDSRSMRANNSSAFNYRKISGSSKLSNHAYGFAIDVNPRINPWVKGKSVSPSNGTVYRQRKTKKCRGKYRNYMIHKNDKIYKIFKKYGFSWGGDWKSSKDYQHFEWKHGR